LKIAIGSDHAGFNLKSKLIAYFNKKGIKYKDFGTYSEAACDYSDYAFPVARAVAAGKFARGVLICGSGVGVSITANRIKGIRAVNIDDLYTARQSREHGDSNVLCLAGRRIDPQKALKILAVWLKTPFSGEARHRRRIKKIDQ
jgi:ribose 5-phosphate isomerase B